MDEERPPSWAGAPGYMPHVELPPHSPMPGAPPYPAKVAPPRPTVGATRPARTAPWAVLAAVAVWAVVDLVLVLLVGSPGFGPGFVAGLAVTAAAAAGAVWLLARPRAWGIALLLLASAPVFWILRALVGALLG